MSLYFVTGKIGSGKSYRGLVTIRRELLHGNRLIVTNLPLKLPELADYFNTNYPAYNVSLFDHWREAEPGELHNQFSVDGKQYRIVDGMRMVFVPSRIRMLEDAQLKEFYLYRQIAAGPVPKINQTDKHNPACLDFSQWGRKGKFAGQGVVYLLDECQLFYNVRKYAEAPDEMPFYLSQHRKLGDDIYALTQKPENVDKMFRSFTEEFLYVTNVGKKRLWIFQAPKFFRMSAFPQMFTGASGQVAEWSKSFRMDFKLAECYETAKGIGIEAMEADKNTAARGISWRWALLLPICLALLFPAYGMISKRVVRKFLGQSVDALTAVKHPTNAVDAKTLRRSTPAAFAQPPEKTSTSQEEKPSSQVGLAASASRMDPRAVAQAVFTASEGVPTVSLDVFFVGVWTTLDAKGKPLTTVALSDRRIFILGVDKELTSVTAKYCVVGGVIYPWRSYDDLVHEAAYPTGRPGWYSSGRESAYPSYSKPSIAPGASGGYGGGVIVGGAAR